MAHNFQRCTNTIWRASLVSALLWIGGALRVLTKLQRPTYMTGANLEREQPVQFSLKHRVADDGIDCRYCHTPVETAAFAEASHGLAFALNGADTAILILGSLTMPGVACISG